MKEKWVAVEEDRQHIYSPAAVHGPCPSDSGLRVTDWLPSRPPDSAPAACRLRRRTTGSKATATPRRPLGTAKRCGVHPEKAAGMTAEESVGEKDRGDRARSQGERGHLDFTGRGRLLQRQLFSVEHACVLTVGRAVK